MAARRRRRIWPFGVAALLVLGVAAAAPPGRKTTRPAAMTIAAPATARGVLHVHTTRSDGSGTIDDVAAAAARAGLQFVALTDHGDGTRAPLAPAYRSGVLVIDGVEISTAGGHYVALGLGQAPYRLAGESSDVAADVRRLGGFGFAAHPDSPKPGLAWRDWDAAIDGLEWFNLDSEWRDDTAGGLARALIFYPLRPVPSLASLAGDGGRLLPRWAALAQRRRVVGVAAVDAHARLGTEGGFDEAWVSLRAPGYQAIFETAQVTVELDAALSGDAARDAAAVLGALREGRSYSTISGRAPAARVAITADRDGRRARMGQLLDGSVPPVVTVEADAPSRAVIRIVCDGRTITQTFASSTFGRRLDPDEMGHACQAVVGWVRGSPDDFVTWAVTNPIYWRPSDPASDAPARAAARSEVLSPAAATWTVEHAAGSQAAVEPAAAAPASPHEATPVRLRYALAEGARAGQFAALVTPDIGTLSWASWLRLRLSADAPMRVSIQLREPLPGGRGRRWQRSIVVGPDAATQVIPLAAFQPLEDASGPPPVTAVRSFLVVVDTTNTPPGRRGEVVVHEIRSEAP